MPSFGVSGPVDVNPVYVPQRGDDPVQSYHIVYETALKALGDAGFEILETNRLDGHIETFPRVAPGVGLALRAGSPALYERVLATMQSYRHRAIIKIHLAPQGGYFVAVTVLKELEDLPRPVRATTGAVLFRIDNDVERRFQIVDPTIFESNWIPKGRDIAMEQAIIQRLKNCR
jgi:hypothetical protein